MADVLIEDSKKAFLKIAYYYPKDAYNLHNYVKFEITEDGLKTRIDKTDIFGHRNSTTEEEDRRLNTITDCLRKAGFETSIYSWKFDKQDKTLALAISLTLPIRLETPARLKNVHEAVYRTDAENKIFAAFNSVKTTLTTQFPQEMSDRLISNIMDKHGYVPKGLIASCEHP